MHLEDYIKDLHSRRQHLQELMDMARPVHVPDGVMALITAREEELTAAIESAEEIDGQPRMLRDMTDVKRIHTAGDLELLRQDLGCRPDWHEPDEQDVNAFVQGVHLDNAMGACADPSRACGEFNIVITHDDKPMAVVNLAMLLSWATDFAAQVRSVIPAPVNEIPF